MNGCLLVTKGPPSRRAAEAGGQAATAARRCARFTDVVICLLMAASVANAVLGRARHGDLVARIIFGNRCFGTSPAASWWWRCCRSSATGRAAQEWAQQISYEMKKDLFNYLAMAVIFWFAQHPAVPRPRKSRRR